MKKKNHIYIALAIGAVVGYYFSGNLKTYPVFSNIYDSLLNS